MTFEDIIQQILISRSDITREEIIEMIEKKLKKTNGYLTCEIAAYLVASELKVENLKIDFHPNFFIKNLVSGLRDVTITGKIVTISPFQKFTSSNGIEGAVKHLLIADESGMLKVVLWNEKAKFVENQNVKPGQMIIFYHGYIREGKDGRIELNLGDRGEIKVL